MSSDNTNSLKSRKLEAEIEQIEEGLLLDWSRFHDKRKADFRRLLLESVRTIAISVGAMSAVITVVNNVIGGE